MEKVSITDDVDTAALTTALDTALKHNKFGGMVFSAGKFSLALEHFAKAESLLQEFGIPYTNTIVNQANVYAQLRDYAKALEKYEQAIQKSPHGNQINEEDNLSLSSQIIMNPKINSREAFIDAHTNAGFTLLGMQLPEKAYEYCLKSMELEPENQQNFINFSNALRMTGRRSEAIDLTWKAVSEKFSRNRPETGQTFKVRTIDVKNCSNLTPQSEEDLRQEPINIITMKWGTKYGPEYVNKLFRGFKKNTNRDFNFILFTDNTEGVLPEIETKPMANEWRALLAKSTIFSREHQFKGLNMWIDLDMIITSNIDSIFDFKGKFALMRTDEIANETLNKGGYNSSVLL